jgi:D-sedoheptulose 7-phosphate isomerase
LGRHVDNFFAKVQEASAKIDKVVIDGLAKDLADLRSRGGRLFILGVGGSAGNCGHAVNDFRKLCNIEAYAPTDNVSELTARANDEGWNTIFSAWLKVSRLAADDALLVFSVGGGNELRQVSVNLIEAIKVAKEQSARVFAVVGRSDGYAAQHGDRVVVIPMTDETLTTPISEAFQAVVWHCLVSHPDLQVKATKW